MSVQVFPTLLGQGWSVKRTPEWKARITENVSGREIRQTDWSYPRWSWDLMFNMLRQGTFNGVANYAELAQLAAFFNSRKGQFDSFLYTDVADNAVVDQAIGTGNGVATTFQLVRSFGGFIEPIYAPNVLTNGKVNGVIQGGATVSPWGSATPGILTFLAAPGNGLPITATFSYYFPVRFVDNVIDFENFLSSLWSAESVKFKSIK